MGGVCTDLNGATTVAGLFVYGEVACTGVQGANRLASNSLLEGLVFGQRSAHAALEWAKTSRSNRGHQESETLKEERLSPADPSATSACSASLRLGQLQSKHEGVIRHTQGVPSASQTRANESQPH